MAQNSQDGSQKIKMNCNIPIIFFHLGYADYIQIALRQAIATNPDSEIVLFGNEASPVVDGVRRVITSDYETRQSVKFRQNYRHMSYQQEILERLCFERWLWIAEFFRREGLAKAFVMDTDVMIYTDLSKLSRMFTPAVKCGLAQTGDDIPDNATGYKPVSGHSSYWTARAIFELETLLLELYVNPELRKLPETRWAEYSQTHIYGGITDMDAIGLFKRGLRADEFINTNELPGCGGVFDLSLCLSDGAVENQYQMHGLIKRLEWRDGLPYGIECKSGSTVRFYTLHCQGCYKSFMAGFYRGPDFAGRRRLTAENNCRKYKFILERMVKSLAKSCLAKIAPELLQRLRQKGV